MTVKLYILTRQGIEINLLIDKEVHDTIITDYSIGRVLHIRTITNQLILIEPKNIQYIQLG